MRPAVRLSALMELPSSGCGRTTRSASARTGRPTSRSSTTPRCARSRTSGSSGRPTRTRPRSPGRSRSSARTARSRCRSRARRCRRSTAPRSRRRAGSSAAPTRSGSRGDPELILISTGAEVGLALEAGRRIADGRHDVRVVSMPCWELFEARAGVPRRGAAARRGARLAIEPGVALGWKRWVGDRGDTVTLDRFGASAPGRPCSSGSASTSRTSSPARPPCSSASRDARRGGKAGPGRAALRTKPRCGAAAGRSRTSDTRSLGRPGRHEDRGRVRPPGRLPAGGDPGGARGARGDRPRHRTAPRFASTTRTRRARWASGSSPARPSAGCSSADPVRALRSPRASSPASVPRSATTVYSAHQAVEHDDMNVLCLGSEIVGPSVARELVAIFLAARFDGGERYVARLEKVAADGEGDEAWRSRGFTRSPSAGNRSGSTTFRGELVHGGGLQRLVDEDAVTGVTSNPTIFQKAIAGGQRLRRAAAGELARASRRPARDLLQACDHGRPGRAATFSAPSGTRRAGTTASSRSRSTPGSPTTREATFEQAIDLHERVDRPNLHVKIPATVPGLPAIEDCIARGRSINVTLIFSLRATRRSSRRTCAGSSGWWRAAATPTKVRSVASFFVSRLDTEGDRRLEELGPRPELPGQARVREREARLQALPEAFAGARWEFLVGEGRGKAAPAVGVDLDEDPAYRDVMYVAVGRVLGRGRRQRGRCFEAPFPGLPSGAR